MNIGITNAKVFICCLLCSVLGGCGGRSKTRLAPDYQTALYYIQLASTVVDECRIETGKLPESKSQIDQIMRSRFEQDRAIAKEFFDKYGDSAFIYKTDGKRYWMYVNKAFTYHGSHSYLRSTSELGVHWKSSADLSALEARVGVVEPVGAGRARLPN